MTVTRMDNVGICAGGSVSSFKIGFDAMEWQQIRPDDLAGTQLLMVEDL